MNKLHAYFLKAAWPQKFLVMFHETYKTNTSFLLIKNISELAKQLSKIYVQKISIVIQAKEKKINPKTHAL